MSLVEKMLGKMKTAQAESESARHPTRPAIGEAVAIAPQPAVLRGVPRARTDKLISVSHEALRRAGLMASEAEERRMMAEYRQIKRPLIAGAKGRGAESVPKGRIIMVASALPSEGKTFTSINLALSMALEKDTTVLLADGDFAKSHLSREFGVEREPGLMDVLSDESRDIASAIIPTTVRGLSFMPAGHSSATATELLSSERMERVMGELLSDDPNRILLFDSPPLLLTTESRALTAVVGQVVVVVRAEETTRGAVVDALKFVPEGKSVGLVLNQCLSAPTHGYYSYGEYNQKSASS